LGFAAQACYGEPMKTAAQLFVIYAVSALAWLVDRFGLDHSDNLPSAERRAQLDAMVWQDVHRASK
jgi:hypothetical protein